MQQAIPTNIPGGVVPPGQQPGTIPQTDQAPLTSVRIAPQVAHALSQPTTRQLAVQSLLADPNAGAQLQQAVPNLQPTQLQQLASLGLDGSQVPAMVSVGNAPGGMPGVGPAPPPGTPQGIGGLNWKAGVHFSPVTGSPVYIDKGRAWSAGSLNVSGVYVSTMFNISHMNFTGLTVLQSSGVVRLYMELPSSGYYLFSFKTNQLDPKTMSDVSYLGSAKGSQTKLTLYDWGTHSKQTLKFTALTDKTGFVAMGYVKTGGTVTYPGDNMRNVSARLTCTWGHLGDMKVLFGGVTVTQL
jgi:hypothetical protein